MSVAHGAERAPSLVMGSVFILLTFEGGLAMLTNLFAQAGVGPAAWLGLFGGSLLNLGVAVFLISRAHPLALYLHRAENEM
jgi:hypothetical protein